MNQSADEEIVYEVSVTVPYALKDRALNYMKGRHIQEVLAHPAFTSAVFLEELDSPAGEFSWSTQYSAKSRMLLESYFNDAAPRLRDDFIKTFEGYDIKVTRRIFKPCSFSRS